MKTNASHILSEKAVKRLGLDKHQNPLNKADKLPVKEWDSSEAYWMDFEEEISDHRAKWYVKVAHFFKYRIEWRTRDWWLDTKWYFSNLRTFRPILKVWRSFDYHYQVDLFKFGIKQLAEAMEYYGHEVSESRHKKIEAMNELIKEIERDYEQELKDKMDYGHLHSATKVVKYSDGSVSFDYDESEEEKQRTEQFYKALAEERKKHYNKIFRLIIGQDDEYIKGEVEKRMAEMPEEKKKSMSESELYQQVYNEVWDGSGIEGWWD